MPRRLRRKASEFTDSATLRDLEKSERSRRDHAQDDDTGEPCARGEHCSDKVSTQVDGKRVERPRLTPQVFCRRDRADIASKVADLPDLYGQLARELCQPAATARPGPRGKAVAPPLLLRGDVDALMRRMVGDLTTWWNRVADAGSMTRLQPIGQADVHRLGYRRVWHVADRLCEGTHLDALFARPPAWMNVILDCPEIGQGIPAWVLDRYPGWRLVDKQDAWWEIEAELDGRRAGLDLLHIHYRCRSVLGQTRPVPEKLLAVACYDCGWKALVRADAPRDRGIAYYSRCRNCGHRMTEPEYRQHVDRLAAGVGGAKVRPVVDSPPAT